MHVEYAERRKQSSILFIFRPFYECSHLEYEHVPVECRVQQPEYSIHILAAAPQEYVNTYSTRRQGTFREGVVALETEFSRYGTFLYVALLILYACVAAPLQLNDSIM